MNNKPVIINSRSGLHLNEPHLHINWLMMWSVCHPFDRSIKQLKTGSNRSPDDWNDLFELFQWKMFSNSICKSDANAALIDPIQSQTFTLTGHLGRSITLIKAGKFSLRRNRKISFGNSIEWLQILLHNSTSICSNLFNQIGWTCTSIDSSSNALLNIFWVHVDWQKCSAEN